MLKETNFNEGDIFGVRLNTTEEVIFRYVGSEDGSLKVRKPRAITYQQDEQGQAQAGLIPMCYLADDGEIYSIEKTSISMMFKVPKEIQDNYTQILDKEREQQTGVREASDDEKRIITNG